MWEAVQFIYPRNQLLSLHESKCFDRATLDHLPTLDVPCWSTGRCLFSSVKVRNVVGTTLSHKVLSDGGCRRASINADFCRIHLFLNFLWTLKIRVDSKIGVDSKSIHRYGRICDFELRTSHKNSVIEGKLLQDVAESCSLPLQIQYNNSNDSRSFYRTFWAMILASLPNGKFCMICDVDIFRWLWLR
jgi:hypothetical protein